MIQVLAVVLVACTVACASGPPRTYVTEEELQELVEAQNTTAEDDDRVLCRRESPTGSRIPTTVCRSVRELRAEREAIRRAPSHNTTGAGGP